MVMSGSVRWTVGEEGTTSYFVTEMQGEEVMVLHSNLPHSVEALEDTVIIDVLSPPAAMGVDSEK